MTNSYLALIRGVNNIGAARPVVMGDIQVLFERLGFRDVHTLLNSGNVIFSAPSIARGDVLARVEKGLSPPGVRWRARVNAHSFCPNSVVLIT